MHLRVPACFSGIAWNGLTKKTPNQEGTGINFNISNYDVLYNRHLDVLTAQDSEALTHFKNAPIVIADKLL